MTVHEFGNSDADIVLIQPVDEHDLSELENEVALIKKISGNDFRLIAVKVDNWNSDLSPWRSPAVFGKDDFGNGAAKMLEEILKFCGNKNKTYYIGGYSLAGLFSLWATYQTDIFKGVAAASPSMWFPGFTDFMKEREIRTGTVYLSLGDREEKTRNSVMATVGEKIREAHALLSGRGVNCALEWNEGNHFREADIRTAKAFSWVIRNGIK